MSLYDYHYSRKLSKDDPPFFALLMAAMRKADSDNAQLLRNTFPDIWEEFQGRYNASLGVLPQDGVVNFETLQEQLRRLVGE